MLELDEVVFAYEGQKVPYRFALRVKPGEIIAIGGESGSGKSTLLDLVAGFRLPSAGRIVLDGDELTRLAPEQRPVSILFQDENLFEHLSAGRNVRLGLPKKLSRTDADARIRSALETMALGGYERRRVSDLSGGQKQRVALARTLLLDRPILLLDEPFSALDSENAAMLRAELKRLTRQKNWHVLLVSHDANDRAGFADTCLRVEDGVLVVD